MRTILRWIVVAAVLGGLAGYFKLGDELGLGRDDELGREQVAERGEPRPKAQNRFIGDKDRRALLAVVVDRCRAAGDGECDGILGPLPGLYFGRRGDRFWAIASFRHPVHGVEGQPLVLRRDGAESWTVAAETDGTVCRPLPVAMARVWDLDPAAGDEDCFAVAPPEAEVEGSARTLAELRGSAEEIVTELDAYWSGVTEETFGAEYRPPEVRGAYGADDAPSCGGEPLGLNNAYYCIPERYIAWDERGLMAPVYEEFGWPAPAIVLAHEYGHAMQSMLGWEFGFTIHSELNADCLAGAWMKAANDLTTAGFGAVDLDEAIDPLFRFRDPEGSEWFDPDAHGTALQRIAAFQYGTAGDVREQCEPTPERPAGFPGAPKAPPEGE